MNPPPIMPLAPVVRRLKRIAPLQAGKLCACMYGAMSLLFVPFILFASLVGGQRFNGLGMGMGMMAIFLPVLYAILGFVIGALGAVIYNLIAGWLGGLEFEVE